MPHREGWARREEFSMISGTPARQEVELPDRGFLVAVSLHCQMGPARVVMQFGLSERHAAYLNQGWVRDLGAGAEPITTGAVTWIGRLVIPEDWELLIRWDLNTGLNETLFLEWMVEAR